MGEPLLIGYVCGCEGLWSRPRRVVGRCFDFDCGGLDALQRPLSSPPDSALHTNGALFPVQTSQQSVEQICFQDCP